MTALPRLSVVTTLYRSAPYMREFYDRVRAAADAGGPDWELIMVNDGSPDAAADVALALHRADPRVVLVDLSRNFGHHKAIMTGLSYARGQRVFLLDVDLEEAPEWLVTFEARLAETGADVAYGVQAGTRKGGLMERLTGEAFYIVFNWLSATPIPRNLVTARLMSRRYVDALIRHREREIALAGLLALTGFHQVPVPVEKASTAPTTYSLAHKVGFLVNAVTSFSNRPLIFVFYLGCAVTLVAVLAAAIQVIRMLFFQALLPGWASLIISIWLLGGLNLFCLGLIGIYLSKVFVETKRRPYTIVRAVHGAEPQTPWPS